MERAIAHDVLVRRGRAGLVVAWPADRPGAFTAVLRALATAGVTPGLLARSGANELTCTVPGDDADRAARALRAAGFPGVAVEPEVAEVCLRGAGLRGDPIVVATFCEALALAGVQLRMLSFEAGELTAACPRSQLAVVTAGLCEAFEVREAGRTSPAPVTAFAIPVVS